MILLIHFLQRKAKVEVISTLFLLKQTQRDASTGNRFEKLHNSIPLWLQLLAVLLITWLLVQPRYINANSTQRIAIVIDSSASMAVFKEKLPRVIEAEILRLRGSASNIEVWLMESDSSKSKIHQGSSTQELLTSLETWQPSSSATDPSNALHVARSLVKTEGGVTYITDTPLDATLPYNASQISIGTFIDNCGIAGISFDQDGETLIWKALIRNYSDSEQTRSWFLNSDQGATQKQQLTLKPGQFITLRGAFPTTASRCHIILESDDFKIDDQAPIIRPEPKRLFVDFSIPTQWQVIQEKILASFPNLTLPNETQTVDLKVSSQETTPTQSHLIVLPQDKVKTRPYLKGSIVAVTHELTKGLNWQPLLARENYSLSYSDTDEVLLWQGERPLILLRENSDSSRQALIFNFDISQSNALKLPAFAIILLRYCEQIREAKVAPENLITESSEPISLPKGIATESQPFIIETLSLTGETLQSKSIPHHFNQVNAPQHPSFFTIRQGDQTILTSACFFADTREADFSQCNETSAYSMNTAYAIDRHTREDHYWKIWVCLCLFMIITAWWFTATKEDQQQTALQS